MVPTAPTRRSRDWSPNSDYAHHDRSRSKHREHYRSSSRSTRDKHGSDREAMTPRNSYHTEERRQSRDNRRKRSRYDSSISSPNRSEWDDGRWEWEDTPRRYGRSSSSRYQQHFPSPKFVGASPDARLVSPWFGGRTPSSSASASPWDSIAPSPTPIRASGSSVRSTSSRYGGRSNQGKFVSDEQRFIEDKEYDPENTSDDQNNEISESMRLEMEYNSDRAWITYHGSIFNVLCLEPT